MKKDLKKISSEEVNQQLAILEGFTEHKEKNEVVQILNELFDRKKINLITDLTDDEIKLITAIKIIADMKDIPAWHTGVEIYMSLLLSRKRRSRAEVIEAVKGYQERMRSGIHRLLPFSDRRR